MDLFSNSSDIITNLLPQDGTVYYYGRILKQPDANLYLECLLNTIAWQHDEVVIFGKHINTKRKVACIYAISSTDNILKK